MNEEDYEDALLDEREPEPLEFFFWFVTGLSIPFVFILIYYYSI